MTQFLRVPVTATPGPSGLATWIRAAANAINQAAAVTETGVPDGDKGDIVVSDTGATWSFDSSIVTAFARTILDDTTAGGVRSTIGAQAEDATLTALAGLSATAGLLEQTGADTFTKRAMGVANSTDVLTRADGDGRYSLTSHNHTGVYQPADVQLDSLAALSYTGNASKVVAVKADETGFELVTSGATYNDESAQDAIGAMIDASLNYVDATPLLQRAALTGDVTASAGSNATTIANDAVTYAKLQNASATSRILARKTAGSGDYEECTIAEVLNFIASSAQGDIMIRDASGWTRLGAGTSGQFLKTQGAIANPAWANLTGYSAIAINPLTTGNVVNVNSTTYLALVPFNFYLDRDTFPATHFRIVIRGISNAAGQTVTCQMADATAPTTGLHTGGDDLTIDNNGGTTKTFDSGWRTFDDGGSGLLFGTIALKGSNSTVDLQFNNAMIMFKK